MGKTLFDKVWDNHIVDNIPNGPSILYVDQHLIHEVTSPQAFSGLKKRNINVFRKDRTVATADHNVPTLNQHLPIQEELSRNQVETLTKNCKETGINLYGLGHKYQGIVHVIGPELGITQPGMTIVCGDSHTSTHGAFGAFALGIGTSEVEHVLATQTLRQKKPLTMEINIDGPAPPGVSAKDIILGIIGRIGVAGAAGHVIEYTGEAITGLSMEGRMTVCNMSIEAGARAGMVAPDQTTFDYIKGRSHAPKDAEFQMAIEQWSRLRSDPGSVYDSRVVIEAKDLEPFVTWGTNPGMVVPVTGKIPNPKNAFDETEKESWERALSYMDLTPDIPITDVAIDRVFIGSCTNSRIEDIRAAATVAKGKKVNDQVYAMVVPGSVAVKEQAEDEGLDRILIESGFDWREAGGSMCLGMNPDILQPKERCASTSNRNFEGRQGKGGRTHLVSPQMAAAAAIEGRFVDIREW